MSVVFSALARLRTLSGRMVSSSYRGPCNSYEDQQTSYIYFRDSTLSWWRMIICRLPSMEVQSLINYRVAGAMLRQSNHSRQLCPQVGPTPVEVMPFGLWRVQPATHLTHIIIQDFTRGLHPIVKYPFVPLLRVGAK